jgi:hypothetical protein
LTAEALDSSFHGMTAHEAIPVVHWTVMYHAIWDGYATAATRQGRFEQWLMRRR